MALSVKIVTERDNRFVIIHTGKTHAVASQLVVGELLISNSKNLHNSFVQKIRPVLVCINSTYKNVMDIPIGIPYPIISEKTGLLCLAE
jgi:hypothetical protein